MAFQRREHFFQNQFPQDAWYKESRVSSSEYGETVIVKGGGNKQTPCSATWDNCWSAVCDRECQDCPGASRLFLRFCSLRVCFQPSFLHFQHRTKPDLNHSNVINWGWFLLYRRRLQQVAWWKNRRYMRNVHNTGPFSCIYCLAPAPGLIWPISAVNILSHGLLWCILVPLVIRNWIKRKTPQVSIPSTDLDQSQQTMGGRKKERKSES